MANPITLHHWIYELDSGFARCRDCLIVRKARSIEVPTFAYQAPKRAPAPRDPEALVAALREILMVVRDVELDAIGSCLRVREIADAAVHGAPL